MSTIVRQLVHFRRRFVLAFLAGIAIFYVASSAIASYSGSATSAESSVGSLALSDLNQVLLNQSTELSQEISQALEEIGQDDVGCIAPIIRFPFIHDLNNSRVAPFSCSFADNKSLVIRARNIATLPDGETVSLEQLLQRNNVPEGVGLQFNLANWQWTDRDH